jgi:hypothetical protein
MSEAQVALFRFLYGFDVLPTVTMTSCVWEKYEVACLNFLEFALLGAQRASGTNSFLQMLGFPSLPQTCATAVPTPTKASEARKRHPRVLTVRAKRRIEPSSCTVDWISPLVQGKAFVVWNAPQASFADIIVILPGEGVLLVQVKCFSEETLLTEYQAQLEMYKMGLHLVAPEAKGVIAAALCSEISAEQCGKMSGFRKFVSNGRVQRQKLYRDVIDDVILLEQCQQAVTLDDRVTKGLPVLLNALRTAATISGGAQELPWIKFCLMTTKSGVCALPEPHAIHFSATSATMLPIPSPTPVTEGISCDSPIWHEVMSDMDARGSVTEEE